MPKTSIIILTYNNFAYTKACLESIEKYTEKDSYEIIIIDNNSTDETRSWLKNRPYKIIFNSENVGFPKGCNQGIKAASKGNDILLLNNDTIVTTNWLTNLKNCLYSDTKIGAVGSVCNQNENNQGVNFSYNDLTEMQEKALLNNVSDKNKWEEKVFLIGFCLLIKNEVIIKLAGLDEAYSPGYIEDNDLSLRIIKLGYKLMLCHDSFIHHYLGTSFRKNLNEFYPILNKNRNYFYQKWHFNTFSFDDIKKSVFVTDEKEVLELDAGLGVTARMLKYNYKHLKIEGIEKNKYKRNFATQTIKTYHSLKAVTKKYDIILIGNVLEKVNKPSLFLLKLKKYLKKDGAIIGEINNALYYQNVKRFTHDEFFSQYPRKNNYTITDIKNLSASQGYTSFRFFAWYENIDAEILKNGYEKYRYYSFIIKKE